MTKKRKRTKEKQKGARVKSRKRRDPREKFWNTYIRLAANAKGS